jgi:hypothetical protein
MSILSKDFIGLGVPILDFSILPASEPTDQPPPNTHGTEKSDPGPGSPLSQNQHCAGPLRPGDMGHTTCEANAEAQGPGQEENSRTQEGHQQIQGQGQE